MNTELMALLEPIIDRNGLAPVLATVAQICTEKAEHIRTNWQGNALARKWEDTGFRLETEANKARDKGLI